MGRIKNWFTNRRLNRLEGDLKMLSQKGINYNPKHYREYDMLSKVPEKEYTLNVQENLVWSIGKPRLLRQFYMHNPELTIDLNYFWQSATTDIIKRHTGIPNMISTKMATILFGGGFTSKVEIFKTDEKGNLTDEIDDDASKKATENLEIIKDKAEIMKHCKCGAFTESWSGHLFAKWNYDLDASNYPILELADVRNAEVRKIRGVTTAIVFKNYYNKNQKQYVHKEIYTTNEKGDATILNELYEIMPSGDERQTSLLVLEETKFLEPLFTFDGLKGMLAFEKPNKLPNNEFENCPYGASDYAGTHAAFDSLDEIFSEMVSEVRNNKTKRYVPENMIPHTRTGEPMDLDPFVKNYVKVAGDLDQDAQNKIEVTEISDKHESLKQKFDTFLTTVVNKAGLSPVALGVTGIEAITSSDKSQQERNKTTLETRNVKLETWLPFLEYIFIQMLALNAWMQKSLPVDQEELNKLDVAFTNCNVTIEFPTYIMQSDKETIDTWGSAKSTYKVSSTLNALRNIHPDWSETQLMDELNAIRFEEGMAFDNPSGLPELTGIDTEMDDEDKDKEKDNPNDEQDIKKKLEDNTKQND